jgi:hypothetical protein
MSSPSIATRKAALAGAIRVGALCVVRLTLYYGDAILAFWSALFANI